MIAMFCSMFIPIVVNALLPYLKFSTILSLHIIDRSRVSYHIKLQFAFERSSNLYAVTNFGNTDKFRSIKPLPMHTSVGSDGTGDNIGKYISTSFYPQSLSSIWLREQGSTVRYMHDHLGRFIVHEFYKTAQR